MYIAHALHICFYYAAVEKQNKKKTYLDCFLLQRLFNCTDATQSVPTWCTLYNDNKVNSILFYIQIIVCTRE